MTPEQTPTAIFAAGVAEGRRLAAAGIREHAKNILATACKDAGIEPTADAAQEHPLVVGLEFAARIADS